MELSFQFAQRSTPNKFIHQFVWGKRNISFATPKNIRNKNVGHGKVAVAAELILKLINVSA